MVSQQWFFKNWMRSRLFFCLIVNILVIDFYEMDQERVIVYVFWHYYKKKHKARNGWMHYGPACFPLVQISTTHSMLMQASSIKLQNSLSWHTAIQSRIGRRQFQILIYKWGHSIAFPHPKPPWNYCFFNVRFTFYCHYELCSGKFSKKVWVMWVVPLISSIWIMYIFTL